MQVNQKAESFCSKIGLFAIVLFAFLDAAYCATDNDFPGFNSEPKTVETGEFKGTVIDAVTGKPIEGAVVVYRWDVTISFIESNTETAGQYDTLTDSNGKYIIPSQSVEIECPPLSRLEPEEIIIYKLGYLWYRLYEGQISSFMIYVPDLTQAYNPKDNIVKLQPWIEEFSHTEHIDVFERDWDYPESPLLEQALRQERALAASETQGPAKNQTKEPGASGTRNIAIPYNRPGAGVVALGGRNVKSPTPKEIEEQRIQKLRNELNSLRANYKQGGIPEEEYKARLYKYLDVSDYEVLGTTAKALKELKDYSAIPVLMAYLKDNIYRKWNFNWSLSSFRDVTGRTDLPEDTNVVPERMEIVKDMEGWWQRNKDKSEGQWLHDMVANGKTGSARIMAMATIAQTKDKSALPSVLQCLSNNEDSTLYEQAIRTLGEIGDQSIISSVKEKLLHENVYVRRQSALTLNKLGDKAGVPVMIASLQAASRNTCSVANAVLKEITGQDFTAGQSLRQLSAEKQKEAIQSWDVWWQANKDRFDAYDTEKLTNILKTDDAVLQKEYLAREAAAQKNPEAPIFDNPDKSPQACLERFRNALMNGDVEKAVSFLSPHIRQDRKEMFQKLGPEVCRVFAKGIGPVIFESRLEQMFYYEMITETDDGIFLYPVVFVQMDDSEWIIQTL